MADAAIALSSKGYHIYFITVVPGKEFTSANGRETLLQLLSRQKNDVKILAARAGYEFEFGTPEYRVYVYCRLLTSLPVGTPVIVSDDKDVWSAAASFHGTYPLVGVLHADEQHYYDLAVKYAGKTDVLACVSERVTRKVKELLPLADKVFTIPCGIHLPDVSHDRQSGDKLRLVYAGRLTRYQKRVGDLVKVAAALKASGTNFHFNIIGDDEAERPVLERCVKEAGISEQVSFRGWLGQQDVARCLSESDVMLMTSDFEGTPIAMMEALAAGCGMVGTRVSGIEDYELHPLAADCFRIFEVGDIEGAVRKINELGAKPPGVRQQAARKLAEAEFSMDVCLGRYINAMKDIPQCVKPAAPVYMPAKYKLYSKILARARYWKVRLTK